MWILFNNDGQVITTIPHGEAIKQGGSFSVYIAFEQSYFKDLIDKKEGEGSSLLYSSKELIEWVYYHIGALLTFDVEGFPSECPDPELIQFKKVKTNESICGFEDGKNYVVYKFKGLPSYTEKFGNHELILRLSDVTRNEEGEIVEEHEVYIQGPINVYVEPTYGYIPQKVNVSLEQIDVLLDMVQKRLLKLKKDVLLDIKEKYVSSMSSISSSTITLTKALEYGKNYRVEIKTNLDDIVLNLYFNSREGRVSSGVVKKFSDDLIYINLETTNNLTQLIVAAATIIGDSFITSAFAQTITEVDVYELPY